MEESSSGTKQMGPLAGNIAQDLHAEKGQVLENEKISPFLEISEKPLYNVPINLDDLDLPPGFTYPSPYNVKIEPIENAVTNDSGHLGDKNKRTHAEARTRKPKVESPLSSFLVLCSKPQESPKAPELNDTIKEGSANDEKKRRGRKPKQMEGNNVNEFLRTRRQLRYLLHRIKYEQSLIDAYSAEGWKGQSLEKLKPEKELQSAKSHILRYKLKIRELFQHLDSSLAVGKLSSLFDTKGLIYSEDIFCAKCGSKDLSLDNDIILCDGACERGFHQFCLEPPLLKEKIPPGDERWFCPGCNCKIDCINMLKDIHGTYISIVDSWEKIFPDAAAAAASGKKLDEYMAVSSLDDSEDDDYDPDKPDKFDLVNPCNNENSVVIPSDSEDGDFDPTDVDPDKEVKRDSLSFDFTSDSEDLGALLDDGGTEHGKYLEHTSPLSGQNQPSAVLEERGSLKNELSCLMETVDQPLLGKRRVNRLDYKKLHNETYEDSASDSSDEDFDLNTVSKGRNTNHEKAEEMSFNSTPFTNSEIDNKAVNQKENSHLPKGTRKKNGDAGTKVSMVTLGSASVGITKSSAHKRLGEAERQKLYETFKENQYPEKAVKEKLANELGLTYQQVHSWFGNTRWSFHHRPQMESSNINEKPPPQQTNAEIEKEER